nr:hypothetical protein [Leptospira sp. mild_001]
MKGRRKYSPEFREQAVNRTLNGSKKSKTKQIEIRRERKGRLKYRIDLLVFKILLKDQIKVEIEIANPRISMKEIK